MSDGKFNMAVFTIWTVAIFGLIGWVMNIVKFIYMLDYGITAMFIARIVGIFFAPLGSILGWFF